MANATELVRALAHGIRLQFLALVNPRVWEVVGGGPLGLSPAVIAALNPQPLPPHELGRQPAAAVSLTAASYGQMAMMATAAVAQGEEGARSSSSTPRSAASGASVGSRACEAGGRWTAPTTRPAGAARARCWRSATPSSW